MWFLRLLLVVAIIYTLIIYGCGVFSLPAGLWFLASAVLIVVAGLVIIRLLGNKACKLTPAQRAHVRGLEQEDVIAMQKAQEAHKKRSKEVNKIKSDKLDDLHNRMQKIRDEIASRKVNINNMDVVGHRDRTLEMVDALITAIEDHRADTIPEAFRVVDEKKFRDNQKAAADADRLWRQFDEKQRRQREAEQALDQAAHNSHMEYLKEKELDELERIRKDAEYYRRYGKS